MTHKTKQKARMSRKNQTAIAILTARADPAEAGSALKDFVRDADGAKIVKTRANGAIFEVACPEPSLARLKRVLAPHFAIVRTHGYEQL